MEEKELKEIARQFRKPDGDFGHEIGMKMNESNLLMNKFAIEKLNPASGDNILEIGPGNGYFVKEIFSINENITYTGADFSDVMVNECTLSNKDLIENKKATFLKAEASDLPFDDNTFNKILTVNTVYFWDNHNSILEELYRVLKPGGFLYTVYRAKVSMEEFPFTQFGFKLQNADEINTMIEENSFTITDTFIKKEPVKHQNENGELIEYEREIVISVATPVK